MNNRNEETLSPFAPRMYRILEDVHGLLAHLTLDHQSGICMCGDPMGSHGSHSDHAPEDSGEYYASNILERIEMLEDELDRLKSL